MVRRRDAPPSDKKQKKGARNEYEELVARIKNIIERANQVTVSGSTVTVQGFRFTIPKEAPVSVTQTTSRRR